MSYRNSLEDKLDKRLKTVKTAIAKKNIYYKKDLLLDFFYKVSYYICAIFKEAKGK